MPQQPAKPVNDFQSLFGGLTVLIEHDEATRDRFTTGDRQLQLFRVAKRSVPILVLKNIYQISTTVTTSHTKAYELI